MVMGRVRVRFRFRFMGMTRVRINFPRVCWSVLATLWSISRCQRTPSNKDAKVIFWI